MTQKKPRNMAVDLLPYTWNEIFGHAHIVSRMKTWISRNNHPYFIFMSGPSGIGKNSLINTYIKATLCEARTPDLNPCGKCTICQMDVRTMGAHNNVIWVEKGQNETVTKQFNHAIEEANTPPYGFTNDPTRFWKFIVINELQSIDKGNLNTLLCVAEIREVLESNKVIFIAMTMAEEEIMFKSKQLHKALKGRACDGYLSLKSFSNEEIHQYLMQFYPQTPRYVKDLVAEYAEGSIRTAIGAMTKLEEEASFYGGSLSEANAADILSLASLTMRCHFWSLLQSCSFTNSNYQLYRELRDYWKFLELRVPTPKLVSQLLKDIDDCIAQGYSTQDQYTALLHLHSLLRPTQVSSWNVILLLRGLHIVNTSLLLTPNPNGIERLLS